MTEKQILPSERIKEIVTEIQKRTQQEAYVLTILPEHKPMLTDSKFGGLPYWDLNKPYPMDSDGEKLLFLAQINLEDAKAEAPFPQTGMLQFFIRNDDVFGIDFDTPDKQDTFRVVYHESIDPSVTEEQIQALKIPMALGGTEDDYESPVLQEVAVQVTKQPAYMGTDSYQFDELFHEVIQQLYGQDIGTQSCYKYLTSDEYDYLQEALKTTGHRMLGYPFFTQCDPREEEKYRVYDTLLFQMDSEMDAQGNDYILWGDCGVGNFFIAHEDLEKGDFSKVLYNWDCF